MDKNNIAKRIIEQKKLNGSKRKPKYATRKLSIGLVSCMLGYALLVSPSSAEAAELDNNQEVVEEVVDTKEEDTNEENVVEEKETPVEETLSDEQAIEEKETHEAPVEEKASEEVAPEETVEEETSNETIKEDKKEENASELEMSEEAKPKAVTAEETRKAKDVSNDVQSKYVALTEEGHEIKGTVKPDNGEAVGWEVSFTSPRGTIAGDYFTIDLSDNLSLKGIEPDHENEYPIEIDGKVVADGVRVDRSTIKYTFNENINDERNVVVSVKGFAYIDKTKVPNNSPKEKISIKVGDTVDEHNINVEYGDPYYTGNNLNGMSQFTEFNPETGEYTQVFYINPDSKTITTSNRNWATGKVAMFIDGLTPDGSPSDVNYTEKDTTVSIQKLPKGTDVPSAIIENPVETDEETMVKTVFRDGGIEITFADNGDQKLRHDNIDSPYIVTVTSTAAPSKTGNNVYSRATLYGDGTKFHIMDNSIVKTVGDTEAQGDKIGYFIEHHVYYTKVDGVLQEDKTFTLHSNKTEGYDYNNYFTSKNEIDDFKFVKVDADNLVENPVYNTDGTIARGNYEPGKTKEVTYIYVRDIKHGSFQEHHIYQTLDENGKVIAEETVTKDGTETTGIDENEYSTSKKDQEGNVVTEEIDKDGYKLVEVKATNDKSNELGVQFDGQGAATCGNYVNGEKLEVTYIYQKQKPVAKKGSFTEHHIYEVYKDGVLQEDQTTKIDIDKTTGTEKDTFTTSAKENGTEKDPKTGFTFVPERTEKSKEITEDLTGKEVESNYINEKDLEVTYVYRKDIKSATPLEETGKFQEHHIYITKDKDGKEIKREVVDGKVSGGTKDMTYTTGKVDKDGFKFVRTEDAKENPSYDKDGKETKGNYKPGVKQEITYVYEKTESELTPLEPSEPVEPKKPEEPNKPGKSDDSKKPGTKETGKTRTETGKKSDQYQVRYVKPESGNVETGVGSVSGIVATLSAAVGGLFASKKRKNK